MHKWKNHQANQFVTSTMRGHHPSRGRGRPLARSASAMDSIEVGPDLHFVSPRGHRGRRGSTSTGRGNRVNSDSTDRISFDKQVVTKYVCNICCASYTHHCNLLTHQVRVHGRQKKKTGRRPKVLDQDSIVNWC